MSNGKTAEKKQPEPQAAADTEPKKDGSDTPASQPSKSIGLGVRLVPVENSDQPVFANYTSLNVSSGVVFIDFGFFEPSVLAALPRVASQGGKLPETINGRLAVRVALTYDLVQNLKRQLDQLVAPKAARPNPESKA